MCDVMIITIDGYDGTGKTTLAKLLADHYGFIYLYKPIIKMFQHQTGCSFEEADELVKNMENTFFSSLSKNQIVEFYCNALIWLKNFENKTNIILDRGILTIFAVLGYPETEETFLRFIKNGAFFDMSIYLTADDEERIKRIYMNDPNDPDLKYPTKWRENNLEEFASCMELNYYKIDTNCKTPSQIFEEAVNIIDRKIEHEKDGTFILRKNRKEQ